MEEQQIDVVISMPDAVELLKQFPAPASCTQKQFSLLTRLASSIELARIQHGLNGSAEAVEPLKKFRIRWVISMVANKIYAIKALREMSGFGLKEAKDAVESGEFVELPEFYLKNFVKKEDFADVTANDIVHRLLECSISSSEYELEVENQ